MHRLVADGALAIVGPSDPDSAAVVRPAAEAAGIPLIALDEAVRERRGELALDVRAGGPA